MGGEKKKKNSQEAVEGTVEKLRQEISTTEDGIHAGLRQFAGDLKASQRDLEDKVDKLSAEATNRFQTFEVRLTLTENKDTVSHTSLDKRLDTIRANLTEDARRFQATIKEEIAGDKKKAG